MCDNENEYINSVINEACNKGDAVLYAESILQTMVDMRRNGLTCTEIHIRPDVWKNIVEFNNGLGGGSDKKTLWGLPVVPDCETALYVVTGVGE